MRWLERINPVAHWVYTCQHSPGWVEPLRVIYDHELVIIRQGKYVTEIDGERYLCQEGDYLVIPPACQHVSWDAGQVAGIRLCVHFDWTTGYPPMDDLDLHCFHPGKPDKSRFRLPPCFVPKQILHGRVRDLASAGDLHERLESHFLYGSDHHRIRARAMLLELLLDILDTSSCKPEPKMDRSIESRARGLLTRYSHQGLETMPSIEDIFADLSCSYAHICRCFKKRYGVSPLTYITTLRINRAKHMLRENGSSISEVAQKAGYSDPAYFSRVFRKYVGVSPKQFRQ